MNTHTPQQKNTKYIRSSKTPINTACHRKGLWILLLSFLTFSSLYIYLIFYNCLGFSVKFSSSYYFAPCYICLLLLLLLFFVIFFIVLNLALSEPIFFLATWSATSSFYQWKLTPMSLSSICSKLRKMCVLPSARFACATSGWESVYVWKVFLHNLCMLLVWQ